jgi:hypothetical protein
METQMKWGDFYISSGSDLLKGWPGTGPIILSTVVITLGSKLTCL